MLTTCAVDYLTWADHYDAGRGRRQRRPRPPLPGAGATRPRGVRARDRSAYANAENLELGRAWMPRRGRTRRGCSSTCARRARATTPSSSSRTSTRPPSTVCRSSRTDRSSSRPCTTSRRCASRSSTRSSRRRGSASSRPRRSASSPASASAFPTSGRESSAPGSTSTRRRGRGAVRRRDGDRAAVRPLPWAGSIRRRACRSWSSTICATARRGRTVSISCSSAAGDLSLPTDDGFHALGFVPERAEARRDRRRRGRRLPLALREPLVRAARGLVARTADSGKRRHRRCSRPVETRRRRALVLERRGVRSDARPARADGAARRRDRRAGPPIRASEYSWDRVRDEWLAALEEVAG